MSLSASRLRLEAGSFGLRAAALLDPCTSAAPGKAPCCSGHCAARAGAAAKTARSSRASTVSLPSMPVLPARRRVRVCASGAGMDSPDADADSSALPQNYCIIEGNETVKDFSTLQVSEIRDYIDARRNRVFLLLEEIRRLRIQLKSKGGDLTKTEELGRETVDSVLPFLPPMQENTLGTYYKIYWGVVAAVIVMGGLIAPLVELRLGLGGQSYQEFINSLSLPSQLAQVDPIVASFCGGAVGVLSGLFVAESNYIKAQQSARCHYCMGTGYLTCGACMGVGSPPGMDCVCNQCAGSGKVMCTACLCTGKQIVTEHDPRFDPFD